MSYFIITRGALGSGKTSTAKELAHVLGAEYIGIDDILQEQNLDAIDPDQGCIPSEQFIKANTAILPRAREWLGNGKIVIFDGCFYHPEAINHLVQNLPYPRYIFTLRVPMELCVERDSQRANAYGEVATRAVHQLVSKFDEGIVIDGNGTIADVIEKILLHLSK